MVIKISNDYLITAVCEYVPAYDWSSIYLHNFCVFGYNMAHVAREWFICRVSRCVVFMTEKPVRLLRLCGALLVFRHRTMVRPSICLRTNCITLIIVLKLYNIARYSAV